MLQLLVLFSVLTLLHEILFVTQDAVVFQGVDRNEFKCLADWAPVLQEMIRHGQPCQKAFRLQLPKNPQVQELANVPAGQSSRPGISLSKVRIQAISGHASIQALIRNDYCLVLMQDADPEHAKYKCKATASARPALWLWLQRLPKIESVPGKDRAGCC